MIGQMQRWLLMIQPIFTARFSGGQYCSPHFSEFGGATCIKFREKVALRSLCAFLYVSYIVPFRNRSALSRLGSKFKAKFCTFSPSCKIRGWVGNRSQVTSSAYDPISNALLVQVCCTDFTKFNTFSFLVTKKTVYCLRWIKH